MAAYGRAFALVLTTLLAAGAFGCQATVGAASSPGPDGAGPPVAGGGATGQVVYVAGNPTDIVGIATARAAFDLTCPAPQVRTEVIMRFIRPGSRSPEETLVRARGCDREARYACWVSDYYSTTTAKCVREPSESYVPGNGVPTGDGGSPP